MVASSIVTTRHPHANTRAIRLNQSSHFTAMVILREMKRKMTATVARSVKSAVIATRTWFLCSIALGIKSTGENIEAILKVSLVHTAQNMQNGKWHLISKTLEEHKHWRDFQSSNIRKHDSECDFVFVVREINIAVTGAMGAVSSAYYTIKRNISAEDNVPIRLFGDVTQSSGIFARYVPSLTPMSARPPPEYFIIPGDISLREVQACTPNLTKSTSRCPERV